MSHVSNRFSPRSIEFQTRPVGFDIERAAKSDDPHHQNSLRLLIVGQMNRRTNFVRELASWIVWPTTLALFLTAYAWLLHFDYNPGLALFALTIAHFLVIMGLEILMPARPDWAWNRDRQVVNDLVHGAMLEAGARLGSATLTIGIAAIAAAATPSGADAVWPVHLPFLVQMAAAVLLYDAVDYWKHRAFHTWAWLWPVHALHHNPTRMHIFKAGRLHFLESSVRSLLTMAPLVILGAPPEIFFCIAALLNAFGNQNHWNVETRLPRIMHLILPTPQVHWLHHARDPVVGSGNYGSFTMLFDHLFGTYRAPDYTAIHDVGIAIDPIPGNLLGQIASPFIWPWLIRTRRQSSVNVTNGSRRQ